MCRGIGDFVTVTTILRRVVNMGSGVVTWQRDKLRAKLLARVTGMVRLQNGRKRWSTGYDDPPTFEQQGPTLLAYRVRTGMFRQELFVHPDDLPASRPRLVKS
jgi:hypothetical protein